MAASAKSPVIGSVGSEFVEQTVIDHSPHTENTVLLRSCNYTGAVLLEGERELITLNLRNLSEFLTNRGVTVKAWTFFSGQLPGAEMLFQASAGPDDVLDLVVAQSIFEDLKDRDKEILHAQMNEEPWSLSVDAAVKANRQVVYITDDWSRLITELNERGETVSTNMDGLLSWNYSVLFAAGAGESVKFGAHLVVSLERFSGMRVEK